MKWNEEFNFVHESLKRDESWIDSIFGPLDPKEKEAIIFFDDSKIMAHIIQQAGIFKSISEARKNGWNKPIPPGFTDLTLTKRKIRVTILNIVE